MSMIKYVIKRRGDGYVKWIFNSGLDNAGRVIPDFVHWTQDINNAMTWQSPTAPGKIAKHHQHMKVYSLRITRELLPAIPTTV